MDQAASQVEWKNGSAELLILSLVEARPRHGYEISKLIERHSGGTVRFTSPRSTRCSTVLHAVAGGVDAGSKKADSAAAITIV
jgi:hypothetical protein